MPRSCSTCAHANRSEIDRALVAGESLRSIAKRVAISDTSLFRHRAHIEAALTEAKGANPQKPWEMVNQISSERCEIRQLIRQCMAQLAESYRTVLLMRDIEDLVSEIARNAPCHVEYGQGAVISCAPSAATDLQQEFHAKGLV